MANTMLGFPNRIDSATLSGGDWEVNLPLTKMQDPIIGRVARTTSVDLVDTQFDVDLTTSRTIRVIGVRNHNLSINALYRVRGSTVSNFATTVYDSGWLDVWPTVFPYSTLEWEDDAYWTGKYTSEEIEGYTTELDHILPAPKIARYWRIEFNDQMNTDGYLEIGRVFIGPAWQPSMNPEYDNTNIVWEPNTEIQKSKAGTKFYQVHKPSRVTRFTLKYLPQDEAFAKAFEIQRQAGIDKEILWIHDPDDTSHSLRRRFIGAMRQLSPLEYPLFETNTTAFEIEENL